VGSPGLDVAPDLRLPREYALQKVAILATTGAGKSNTAVRIAERLYKAKVPFVTVDPKGDWWGMQASSDGDGPGLPIPVFGGEHGNVPLNPTGGKIIARAIAEQRFSAIIDTSGEEFETRASMFRFLTDFASTLLRVNRHPLHVFAEECDDYLPQAARGEGGDLAKCLGAWQRLVKRGRNKGMGVTLISQRSASVNKDALNMAQTMIAMRTSGSRDVTAIKEWPGIVGPAPAKPTPEDTELLASLPELEHGEAWIVSPQWLKVRQRVHFYRRETFDSGATPELDDDAMLVEPTTLADIDVAALGAQIAESAERAKADDPDELKRQLAESRYRERALGLEVDALRQAPDATPEIVEVPIVPPGFDERLAAFAEALEADLDAAMGGFREGLRRGTKDAIEAGQRLVREAREAAATQARPPAAPLPERPGPPPDADFPAGTGPPPEGVSLKLGARRMLAALSLERDGLDGAQLATWAHVKRGGTFSDYLRSLVQAGFVQEHLGRYHITETGRDAVEEGLVPADRQSVIRWWLDHGKLKAGARRMLSLIWRDAPRVLTTAELSDRADVRRGGTFSDYVRSLVSAGLVDQYGDGYRLREWLW
jgi:hypothetical protein